MTHLPTKHRGTVRFVLTSCLGLLLTTAARAEVPAVRDGAGNPPAHGVVISEFMARNASSLADEDGDESDWIELQNLGLSPVSLEGWFLTDAAENLTRWRIPARSLEPGAFLVVFASGKDRAPATGELHTNFQLNGDGEYLALVAPDGVTVIDEIAPAFPEQLDDVAYGLTRWTTELVGADTDLLYHVPAPADAAQQDLWIGLDFSPADWSSGKPGLGFSEGTTGAEFEVTCIRANVAVQNTSDAWQVVEDPSWQLSSETATSSFIDYYNSGGRGNFANDFPFPGLPASDIDDFVVLVTGSVVIPEAGTWSFGVNSDDGFELELSNGNATFSLAYPNPRAPDDSIGVFEFAAPGPYDVTLVFFERGGGAGLEFFAAKGNHPSYNPEVFRLVGDVENGGLGVAGFGREIATDVGDFMRGVNASLWTRAAFDVADPDELGRLTLNIQYEDGFIAYLNGAKVAASNAPEVPAWNSSATSDRPLEQALVRETIDLTGSLPLLHAGRNVLAIQGLNDAAADGDFLLAPQLVGAGKETQRQYLAEPTPGEANRSGAIGFVRDVQFSIDHGFFETGFSLALATATEGAHIRYTLDGSTPSESNGLDYTAPVLIDGTSCVRAIGLKADHLASSVGTRTYFFVEDVIRQSPSGEPPGPAWPSGSVNGQQLDYGMDPQIVNNSAWGRSIRAALQDIPSLSLVTDLDNLFSPATGIYVNAGNDGRAWEREVSVELVHSDGTPGFAVNAGLRIRGAFSRTGGNPKHSFRLFFRSEYGPGRLRYPLFGDEGVDEFDNVDLRTSQNYSWAFEGSDKNTMIRDVFSRDVQRDMGQPYTRSRYYHLYLNGQYWGIYQTQERVDADYAESYLGGNKDDFDIVKNNSSGSRALEASAGTMDAYRRLYEAAVAGFASDVAYREILGQLPDGSPDPDGEKLLNPENLMDYMVCTYYTGDPDSPVSCWAHFSNNIFASYNRAVPDGFIWFRHDAEHSLGANGGEFEGRLLTDPVDRSIGQDWSHFNPAWLHVQLTANDEYRMQFADRVVKHFFNGGVLTAPRNIERWMQRAAQIDLAIIAESARWGDAKRSNPRTKNDWLAEQNYMLNRFFPSRNQTVINQMRSVGMFPDQAIVFLSQPAGEVDRGLTLTLSQGNGDQGTVYYTLDGSDPRVWGGGLNPAAAVYQPGVTTIVLQDTTTLKARVRTGVGWGALTEARYTVGLRGLVINELMASNQTTLEDPDEPGEFPDWIELYNRSDSTIDLSGLYLSDDPLEPAKWQFAPGTLIDAGGHLLVHADDDGTQGGLHTNFQLSRNGETLLLVDRDGTTILDSVTFGVQLEDIAYGRYPDGGETWGFHQPPTPGAANQEPIDPDSDGVRILGFTIDGDGTIALEWVGCAGCTYEVQWIEDLASDTWSVMETVTASSEAVRAEFGMPPGTSRAFFRVVGPP